MANELAIPSCPPATTATTTAPSAESPSGANDFVAALASVLTTEASLAAAATVAPPMLAEGKDESTDLEEVVDADALSIDPQTFMLSLDQALRTDVPVQAGSRDVAYQASASTDRVVLSALATATTSFSTGHEMVAEDIVPSAAATQAARGAADALLESKTEAKPAADNANPVVMTANATTHERIAELREHPTIRAHVGTSTWTEELAGKLTVMIGKGLQSASLQLSPEHLGPLEVRISVQNEQASVWFGAAHAETRSALEHALPRLRELLAGQGLNLSDAGVFREAPRQQGKPWSGADSGRSSESEREFKVVLGARGLVDAYA